MKDDIMGEYIYVGDNHFEIDVGHLAEEGLEYKEEKLPDGYTHTTYPSRAKSWIVADGYISVTYRNFMYYDGYVGDPWCIYEYGPLPLPLYDEVKKYFNRGRAMLKEVSKPILDRAFKKISIV